MEITVRDAVVDDAGAIATINLASWEAAYRGIVADAFLDSATVAGRAARWRELITAGTQPVLVALAGDPLGDDALAGDALAGYCSLSLPGRDSDTDDVTAEVVAIYVAPDAFRGGVGAAMLTASLELMRARGFRVATLWVLSENRRARAFYARHGFVPDGTVKWHGVLEAEEMRLRREL